MTDTKQIAAIFNGFMALYKGEKQVGLKGLYESYGEHRVFLALIAHLDEVGKLPIAEVLHEVYDFYKKYRDEELTDEDWEPIVEDTRVISAKYKDNPWCTGILIEMLNLLEADDKERRQLAKEMEEAAEQAEKAA